MTICAINVSKFKHDTDKAKQTSESKTKTIRMQARKTKDKGKKPILCTILKEQYSGCLRKLSQERK